MNFLKAVKENNVALIESLFDSRDYPAGATAKGGGRGKKLPLFDPNARSVYGRTALHLAATWDRREIVRILVNCPIVNVNLTDRENGWTALHRWVVGGKGLDQGGGSEIMEIGFALETGKIGRIVFTRFTSTTV